MTRRVVIPDQLAFAELALQRDATGSVRFAWPVIDRICIASEIDPAVMRAATPEDMDNVAGLIVAWYDMHLQRGGAPDPVAEQLLAEVRAEDGYGGSV